MSQLTRQRFLAAAGSGTLLLWLQSCGGGGADAGSGSAGFPPALSSCGASGAAISSNHGHAVTIAVTDLSSATDKTYGIQGTADHDHSITLTVAQLQALKAGGSVMVVSTQANSAAFGTHNHQVTVSCV